MDIDPQAVRQHYSRPALLSAILTALENAGKKLDELTPDDLAPVDEFHTRGRPATVELANLLGLTGTERVLDLGSGLGGPARFLARTYGCRVTGIDLTPEFVEIAKELARLTRLEHHVSYREGDALAIPFADATFDVVWSQNVAMNIADRPRLYAEIRRVLRRGGKYAFSDVVSGPSGNPYYPVPWAREPSVSYLLSAEATRMTLERAGFHVSAWEDTTAKALAAAVERSQTVVSPSALGLHLIFGMDWPQISANILRNYQERKIGIIQGVAVPAALAHP